VTSARGLGNMRHRATTRGGTVRIESALGGGTTLYVILPF
jgi:signal transduction histidine kinase